MTNQAREREENAACWAWVKTQPDIYEALLRAESEKGGE